MVCFEVLQFPLSVIHITMLVMFHTGERWYAAAMHEQAPTDKFFNNFYVNEIPL